MRFALVFLTGCTLYFDSGHDDPPITTPPDPPSCEAHPIYLSRIGGVYQGGSDDSSQNVSSILTSTVDIAPPAVDQAEWDAFVACVSDKFAPFAITVTELDPGAQTHTELVAINRGSEIGVTDQAGGLAPVACEGTSGKVFDRGVVFFAWAAIPAADRRAFGTQVIAESLGLDDVTECHDVMSSGTTCGPPDAKTFMDADLACIGPTCRCGEVTQNSFAELTAKFGPACP